MGCFVLVGWVVGSGVVLFGLAFGLPFGVGCDCVLRCIMGLVFLLGCCLVSVCLRLRRLWFECLLYIARGML